MRRECPIVLVFRSSHVEISRRAFDGLFAFARQAGWNVQTVDYARAASVEFSLPPHTGLPDVKDLLAFWRPAGCIVEGSIAPWALDPKMFSSVPTVFFEENPDRLPRQAVNVTCDGEAIAACAARELLSLRLDDYAFVASDYGMVVQSGEHCSAPRQPGEIYWCRARRLAFERLVRMNGRRFHLFAYETITRDSDIGSRRRRLARWIADLPKPCGILAVNDYTALQVIAACNELKIAIPDEVALVGVDDDAALCENSTPTLSSVRPDHERCGWQAAELLDEMITSGKRRLPSRTFGVAEFVRRESSRRQPGVDMRVRRALEFIRKNACSGIEPPQVIAEMGCSRSLANLLFRQNIGHTILDEIHAVRLEKVKEFLTHTDMDFAAIPDFCGYASLADLRRVFRQRIGYTLGAYRKQNYMMR